MALSFSAAPSRATGCAQTTAVVRSSSNRCSTKGLGASVLGAGRRHQDGASMNSKSGSGIVSISRRSLLELPIGLGLVSMGLGLGPAYAEVDTSQLPKQYLKLAPKLVDAMLASLELEEEGAPEFAVRRKADEAKPLVKEFVAKWKSDPRLSGDKSQEEIKDAMRELADHYMKNGQRTAIPRNVLESVRGHLLSAKGSLPEVEEKGGFLGLGL